jgi:tetratricopeptide (TPR) repeat protein
MIRQVKSRNGDYPELVVSFDATSESRSHRFTGDHLETFFGSSDYADICSHPDFLAAREGLAQQLQLGIQNQMEISRIASRVRYEREQDIAALQTAALNKKDLINTIGAWLQTLWGEVPQAIIDNLNKCEPRELAVLQLEIENLPHSMMAAHPTEVNDNHPPLFRAILHFCRYLLSEILWECVHASSEARRSRLPNLAIWFTDAAIARRAVDRNEAEVVSAFWNTRAGAFKDTSRFREALDLVNWALEVNPKNWKALVLNGVIYLRIDDLSMALNCFQRASLLSDGESELRHVWHRETAELSPALRQEAVETLVARDALRYGWMLH